MMLSEVIRQLQEIKNEVGDCQVLILDVSCYQDKKLKYGLMNQRQISIDNDFDHVQNRKENYSTDGSWQ